MHGIPPPTTPLSDPSERLFKTSQGLTISIPDPWDPRWTSPVKGAMYGQWNDPWPSSHIYIWRSYVQVQTKVHAEIQHQETILTNQITSHSFSWLNLLRGGIQLANLTGIGNLSACLLCATLGRPPLTAVPLTGPLNNTLPQTHARKLSISGVSLYTLPDSSKLAFCYSNASTTLCNRTTPPHQNLTAPDGLFFWCNETLSKNLTVPLNPSLPVTLAPQLTMYTPTKFQQIFIQNHPRQKRAVFLPLVARLSLAVGLGGGALAQSLISTDKLTSQFQLAIDASIESLASLQRQITSVAQVSLQNLRALDLLTAEKGGTCIFLQEECCYYINKSGIVETRVHTLQKLSSELQRQKFSSEATS